MYKVFCNLTIIAPFCGYDLTFQSLCSCMLQVIVNVLCQEKPPFRNWQAQKVIVVVPRIKEIWDFLDQDRCKVRNHVNAYRCHIHFSLTKCNIYFFQFPLIGATLCIYNFVTYAIIPWPYIVRY